jgi:leucyl-tRNA synthetase
VRSEEASGRVTVWLAEQDVAEARINYRLHDWCISRQRYWGPPIPIIYCDACGTVPVPERDLPVVLPHVENYKPDESGISPLARVEDWYRVPCPTCGAMARRETDVSDTFLDSAWYFLRYPSATGRTCRSTRRSRAGGCPCTCTSAATNTRCCTCCTPASSRWCSRTSATSTSRSRSGSSAHGLLIKEGSKMSKSRGNVVIPDRYIEEWGADTFRTYLMFLGPYQEGGDFRDQGLQGPFGFLKRLWDAVVPVDELGSEPAEGEIEQKLHATIAKVGADIAALSYNTAIAAMMEYLNAVRAGNRRPRRAEVEPLVVLAAPFAPHVAEELWELLGHTGSIFRGSNWPEHDPAKAVADTVEFVVQVNGKVRARMSMRRGITQQEAQDVALADENVRRHVDGGTLRKVIFVPDRLLNLVTN